MFNSTRIHAKILLTGLLVVLSSFLLFSQVSNAASWTRYDNQRDAVVFAYEDISGFLNRVGGYMEVYYQDEDKNIHGPIRFDDMSGKYYATANGVHTIRFYRPDGKKYGMSFYQTIVHQVQEDTWLLDEIPTFGYDGEDNFGEDPNE